MSACAQCGSETGTDRALCSFHHDSSVWDDWAKANRIICDWIHRGVVPTRLEAADRDDSFWGHVGDTTG
jgi:hypothetical protein